MKKQSYCHNLLLTISIALGTVLRFTNLELKPPWSDEWATLVFSLGNSFLTVAIDRVIDLNSLLSPLQLQPATGINDVVNNLLTESTHPPLYFVITHGWLQLFAGDAGLVSLWWGRALTALLGVATIPAIFGVSWLLFRSLVTAEITALLMAVSPLGVYLAQETRHYTLAILWILASLACLTVAIRCLTEKKSLGITIIFIWIIVNCLGVATHYFFSLALMAEILVLLIWWYQDFTKQQSRIFHKTWRRIYWAILGTVFGCFPWVIVWGSIPDNQLTSWVFAGNTLGEFYAPLLRILLWIITMFALLPVEGVEYAIAILSGIIILLFLVWAIPQLIKSFNACYATAATNVGIKIISIFLLSAIAFLLTINYMVGADLTLSARFQFIYYPAIILLLGVLLSFLVKNLKQKKLLAIFILIGLLGSLTVINNFAFQKVERSDLVVPIILNSRKDVAPNVPIIIATRHQSHGQTGEMMSIGWQLQKLKKNNQLNFSVKFFLAHQTGENEAE
ncbi:MAG: hypothetical protein AB4372_39110, partial [Xenococcus sp. (in: cyanobacteria)]